MKLLLHQQPVASDLRLISAALKMITDMERIGDQAGDIAELVTFMAGEPYIKKLEHLPQMAAATQRMLTQAIDAFVRRDLALAQQVMEMDDIVDGLFEEMKSELILLLQKDTANASQCIDFLMIAKYYERIGDHAVNIAEWVEYAITGVHKERGRMIYYVEDDRNIRELVVYALCSSGLAAEGFAEAGEFWEALRQEKPELVLLDIMLPGQDGVSILKELRENAATADLPVLMLTAKGSVYDKVVGLDSGADDYLAKPFEMVELISRVKALLRRSQGKQSTMLRIGSITVDDARHIVLVDGKSVTLTLKEYDLLLFLAQNGGFAFSREQLLSRIWGYDYGGGTPHGRCPCPDAAAKARRREWADRDGARRGCRMRDGV